YCMPQVVQMKAGIGESIHRYRCGLPAASEQPQPFPARMRPGVAPRSGSLQGLIPMFVPFAVANPRELRFICRHPWGWAIMKIIVQAFLVLCVVVLAGGTKAMAGSKQFYLELLAALDHAQLKARLGLDSGTWKSTVGDT